MKTPDGIEITGPIQDRYLEIPSPQALELAVGGLAALILSKDPGGERSCRQQGLRRQGMQDRRRLSRLPGRPPRHGGDLQRGVHQGHRRPAQPPAYEHRTDLR